MNEELDELDELEGPEGAPKAQGETTVDVPPIQTETISKPESNVLPLIISGGNEELPGRHTVIATVSMASPANAGQHAPSSRVSVKIEYPKNWKKDRHFKDGDIKVVAPETAKQFIAMGIATMFDEQKAE